MERREVCRLSQSRTLVSGSGVRVGTGVRSVPLFPPPPPALRTRSIVLRASKLDLMESIRGLHQNKVNSSLTSSLTFTKRPEY